MANYLELIIYGSVAGYVIYRLYTKLGKDDEGHKRDHRESLLHQMYSDQAKKNNASVSKQKYSKSKAKLDDDSVVIDAQFVQTKEKDLQDKNDINDFSSAKLSVLESAKPIIKKYKTLTSNFDEKLFLKASVSVFGLVYNYFSEGNIPRLRSLLHKDVAIGFENLIQEKVKLKQRWDFEVLNIKSAKVTKAKLKGNIATITVTFSSNRVEAIYNSEGQIIKNSSPDPFIASDQWVFEKNLTNPSPEWFVTSTKSL